MGKYVTLNSAYLPFNVTLNPKCTFPGKTFPAFFNSYLSKASVYFLKKKKEDKVFKRMDSVLTKGMGRSLGKIEGTKGQTHFLTASQGLLPH